MGGLEGMLTTDTGVYPAYGLRSTIHKQSCDTTISVSCLSRQTEESTCKTYSHSSLQQPCRKRLASQAQGTSPPCSPDSDSATVSITPSLVGRPNTTHDMVGDASQERIQDFGWFLVGLKQVAIVGLAVDRHDANTGLLCSN